MIRIFLLLLVALSTGAQAQTVGTVTIQGRSLEPFISDGQSVDFVFGSPDSLTYGDIVLFTSILREAQGRPPLAKIVVAGPGDSLSGLSLPLQWRKLDVIPMGQVYVSSGSWRDVNDSSRLGLVSVSDILGVSTPQYRVSLDDLRPAEFDSLRRQNANEIAIREALFRVTDSILVQHVYPRALAQAAAKRSLTREDSNAVTQRVADSIVARVFGVQDSLLKKKAAEKTHSDLGIIRAIRRAK